MRNDRRKSCEFDPRDCKHTARCVDCDLHHYLDDIRFFTCRECGSHRSYLLNWLHSYSHTGSNPSPAALSANSLPNSY